MGAGDTLGQLSTERFLDLHKLGRLHDVQYLLQLSQQHHLRESERETRERERERESASGVCKNLCKLSSDV